MAGTLKDKVIVITGATAGFGRAMAEKFAPDGPKLVLVARGESKLKETSAVVEALGAEVVPIAGDVCQSKTFEQVLTQCMHKFGRIDILINNAGGGIKIANIEEQTEETIRQCLDLNLSSVLNSCRIIVPQLKKQNSGLIINVTSACDRFGWPTWGVYSAAKAGVKMFSRCLYAEVRPHNIGVTVLVPGGSNTDFLSRVNMDNFEWNEAEALRPEHIADATYAVCTLDEGGVVPEINVYGKAQEIVPF